MAVALAVAQGRRYKAVKSQPLVLSALAGGHGMPHMGHFKRGCGRVPTLTGAGALEPFVAEHAPLSAIERQARRRPGAVACRHAHPSV